MFSLCYLFLSVVYEYLTTLSHPLSAHLHHLCPPAACFLSPLLISSHLLLCLHQQESAHISLKVVQLLLATVIVLPQLTGKTMLSYRSYTIRLQHQCRDFSISELIFKGVGGTSNVLLLVYL